MCEPGDRSALVRFIDTHWKKDHIFVRDSRVLDWQHGNPGGSLNFAVAAHPVTGELSGVLGYIPLDRYTGRRDWSEAYLALWKALPFAGAAGTGLLLLEFIQNEIRPSALFAIGLTRQVMPLYRSLGFMTGQMHHHVLPNRVISAHRLMQGVPSHALRDPLPAPSGRRLIEVDPFSPPFPLDPILESTAPRKNWAHFLERYGKHPFFRYRIFALTINNEPEALIVTRAAAANGGSALRIVDFAGAPVLDRYCALIHNLIMQENLEYADLYQHGLDAQALSSAGLIDRGLHPGFIVPNYFEPFELKNIDLRFAYRPADLTAIRPVLLFRGDADQDRPN